MFLLKHEKVDASLVLTKRVNGTMIFLKKKMVA